MELRHFHRLPTRCPIEFSGEAASGQGIALNISRNGFLVQSPRRVPRGSDLKLRLFLPDGGWPLDVELAEVRWSRGRRLGLKTLVIEDEAWERLGKFIKHAYENV